MILPFCVDFYRCFSQQDHGVRIIADKLIESDEEIFYDYREDSKPAWFHIFRGETSKKDELVGS